MVLFIHSLKILLTVTLLFENKLNPGGLGVGGIPWHPPPPKNHACRIGGVEESVLLLICACRWDNSLFKIFQYLSQDETLLFSQQKCDLKVAKLQIFNYLIFKSLIGDFIQSPIQTFRLTADWMTEFHCGLNNLYNVMK